MVAEAPRTESAFPVPVSLDCDLCIIGAGYAALNGLNAAANYLKKGARVVVVDRNETWGGQWISQYDFVRLHQPYRMFTAGDQPWTLDRDRSHLASRSEVLDHLASVPGVSAGHLEIIPLFRHEYAGHRVMEGQAEVNAVPLSHKGVSGPAIRIRARRLLKATGYDIESLRPLNLSSSRVRSVGVSDPVLMTPEFLESTTPVYVIGSGKTAMDCVRHILEEAGPQGRAVNIVTGSGMWFLRRDKLFPTGPSRFVRGTLAGDIFLRLSQLFDGQNEAEVMLALEREGLAMTAFGRAGNCRFGLLSPDELSQIQRGIQEVHRGHLVDVSGERMILRENGAERSVPIAPGSWLINCTSHLRAIPHEPLLQEGGLVCAPQSPLCFTGPSAYYVTHLWYRDELATVSSEAFRVPIDVEPRLRFAPHMGLMILANMVLMCARLPLAIPLRFQGDFNRWYPLYRHIPTITRIAANKREVLDKAGRFLQRYADSVEGIGTKAV